MNVIKKMFSQNKYKLQSDKVKVGDMVKVYFEDGTLFLKGKLTSISPYAFSLKNKDTENVCPIKYKDEFIFKKMEVKL